MSDITRDDLLQLTNSVQSLTAAILGLTKSLTALDEEEPEVKKEEDVESVPQPKYVTMFDKPKPRR